MAEVALELACARAQPFLAREQIAILGFGNQRVETLLPRRRAPRALRRLLDELGAGGGTPLLILIVHYHVFY